MTPARGRRAWDRVAALRVLALADSPGWPEYLVHALADGTRDVVGSTVALLGQLDDPRAARILVDGLRAGAFSRSRIATALEANGQDVASVLVDDLQSPQADVRYWAAMLLRRRPETPGLATRLVVLTSDPEAFVRKAALDALASVGGPGAIEAAQVALGDPASYVRAQAARSLGVLGVRSSASLVLPLLADADWHVRAAAKEYLEAMGPAVEHLVIPWLSHPDGFARNGAAEVLQNVGTFERLVAEEARGPSQHTRLIALEQLAAAGGYRMWDAVLSRIPERDRPKAHALLSALADGQRLAVGA
jgi:HEAT repeat protein